MRFAARAINQILASLIVFLLQISSFNEFDSQTTANFSILILVHSFFILLNRRLSLETLLINKEVTKRPSTIELFTICFFLVTGLTLVLEWNLILALLTLLFTLAYLILDYNQFQWQKHQQLKAFYGNILVFTAVATFLTFRIDIIILMLCLDILLIFFLVITCKASIVTIFNLNMVRELQISRGFDYCLSSSLNYFVPLLVLILLGEADLIQLRAAQTFVSIANFFTMSLYIHELNHKGLVRKSIFFFAPSVMLLLIDLLIKFTPIRSFPILASWISSIPSLVYLLISILILIQFSNYWTLEILSLGKQDKLMIWHSKSFILGLFIYPIFIEFYGLLGFCVANLILALADSFMLRKMVN